MGICGWFGHGLITISILVMLKVHTTTADNSLKVRFQWKEFEFNWPDEETKLIFSETYVREKNNAMGLAVAGDRLFITIPRWRDGVAATLNYVYLNDTSESPLLNAYPSWDAHRLDGDNVPEVISTFRIWADKCDRLWVLDTGTVSVDPVVRRSSPKLVVYDLTNDQVLRSYVIPTDQWEDESVFGNIVVEDNSCDDSFAYLADLDNPGLVVYDWENNDSWLVQHHYFSPDPVACHFNTSGVFFQWWDGVINLAYVPAGDGYGTLYFSPLCTLNQFSVSTRILRDSTLASAESSFYDFKLLGSRGANGQSVSSYADPTTGVIFQSLPIANTMACWNPKTTYGPEQLVRFFTDDELLVFPGDVKVDGDGNLWTISNHIPTYSYGEWDSEKYNYRVLTVSTKEAVAGTACAA